MDGPADRGSGRAKRSWYAGDQETRYRSTRGVCHGPAGAAGITDGTTHHKLYIARQVGDTAEGEWPGWALLMPAELVLANAIVRAVMAMASSLASARGLRVG